MILVSMGVVDKSYNYYCDDHMPVKGQLLIHELTCAWQIEHGPSNIGYLQRGLKAQLAGSKSYDYGPPGPEWNSMGLEQLAAIVDDWCAGTSFNAPSIPAGREDGGHGRTGVGGRARTLSGPTTGAMTRTSGTSRITSGWVGGRDRRSLFGVDHIKCRWHPQARTRRIRTIQRSASGQLGVLSSADGHRIFG
jgi:hypothetical protein